MQHKTDKTKKGIIHAAVSARKGHTSEITHPKNMYSMHGVYICTLSNNGGWNGLGM